MTAYDRGASLERRRIRDLTGQGWAAWRVAGSRGPCDVIAARHGDIHLEQCKAGGRSAFAAFGPAERGELSREAALAGGSAALVWRPEGKRAYEVIPAEEWPD
ncbi:MAG: hypothetical protein ACRD2Z_03310 [Thermoanaerobaculia bacterium]